MNIALGAVFIFILLIPPIAFYFSYTLGNNARPGTKFSILEGLLLTSILSLLIHGIAIQLLIEKEIRFDLLLKLVGGEIKDLENKTSNRELEISLFQFAKYNLVVNGIMVFLGWIFRFVIIKFASWGVNSELLRLRNNWWYFFEGYNLPNEEDRVRGYDYIFLDALVDTPGGSMIYSGVMIGFICKGEELDRIYLGDVERRELRKKAISNTGQAYEIDKPGDPIRVEGQLLSIAYSQIKNLNIRFITIGGTVEEIEKMSVDNPPSEK